MKKRYPNSAEELLIGEDIKGVVEIKGVKVGVESQGDPSSRMCKSIDDFVNKYDCLIIVAACRTKGNTYDCVEQYLHKGKNEKKQVWDMILCKNEIYWGKGKEKANIKLLNQRYADRVVQLIEDRIDGII